MSRPRQPRSPEALNEFLTVDLPFQLKQAIHAYANEYGKPQEDHPDFGTALQRRAMGLGNTISDVIHEAYCEGIRQGSKEAL